MNWLQKVVSTTLVVVTGCVIALVLTLFYMTAVILGRELDPITFGSMLAFSAAFAGVGYKQFKAKRETEWAEDDDGVAYRPGTRITRDVHPSERYNAGIKNPVDFSDVNIVEHAPPKTNTRIPIRSEKDIPKLSPAPQEEWEEVEGA